jgi:purine-binding chemotaxis protein CheW
VTGSAQLQLCTLHVGDTELAVDIMRVREVTTLQRVSPGAGNLDGVIDVQGRPAPVIDLRRRIGLPPLEGGRGARVLVVTSSAGPLGLLADRAGDVVTLPASSLRPMPGQGRASLIAGAARHQGRVILLLDLAGLLATAPRTRRRPARRRAGNG